MEESLFNTTCTMDCPDTCSLDVKVVNGKIKSIKGNNANPVTNGFICSKISKFAKWVYSKDRILYPLLIISPASNKMTNSTMGEFNYPELIVTINQEDAKQREIKSNDIVKIFNDLGVVIRKAKINN